MSVPVVEEPLPLRDCPECGAAGSVLTDFCEVCYAEFGEGAADLPPAVSEPHEVPYRMADVVSEIKAIGLLAAATAPDRELGEACARAERLLRGLRRQFVADVILGHPARPPIRSVP